MRIHRNCLLTLAVLAACDAQPEARRSPHPTQPAAEPADPTPIRVPTLAEIAARVDKAAVVAAAAETALWTGARKLAAPDGKALSVVQPKDAVRFHGRDGQLGDDGRALLDLLGALGSHGIDAAGFALPALDGATHKVAGAFESERAAVLALERTPRAALVAAAAAAWVRGGEGGEVILARAGGDRLGPQGLVALDRHLASVLAAAQTARLATVAADLALWRAALRYVVEFRFAAPAHPHRYTTPAVVRRLADQNADAIGKLLKGAARVADVLAAQWPTHPQYPLLRTALAQCRERATGGGWQVLPKPAPKVAKKGEAGPWIAALRERLAAEGYTTPPGEAFDDDLESAVKDFQARHQLEPDGVVAKSFVTEADVPIERRCDQIALALQRYRESEGRDPEDFFLFVSIPFQKLWVYENGAIVREHRVIVGNNDLDIDQLTQMKGKINRTKMFSKPLTRVILAPRWYPTQRVIELEIGKELIKDPLYLEKHGYVREMQSDGTEVVYQKGGKDNLLGEVKLQGPNKHNIYLHDTPFRELFKKPRRPFSHGCVRTQDALDLAMYLLERDDNAMSRKEVKGVLKEAEEKIVQFKKPVPLHIEYVSAAVDAQGRAMFGWDVYGYDQAFFDGQLPVEEAKEYKAGSVKGL